MRIGFRQSETIDAAVDGVNLQSEKKKLSRPPPRACAVGRAGSMSRTSFLAS